MDIQKARRKAWAGSSSTAGTPDAMRLSGYAVATQRRSSRQRPRNAASSQRKAVATTLQTDQTHEDLFPGAPVDATALVAERESQLASAMDGVAAPGAEENDHSPSPGRLTRRRMGKPSRRAVSAACALLALALVLLALFPGDLQPRATITRVQPTVAPTATATAVPTPAALPGFTLYMDRKSSFSLQYPSTWMVSPKDFGVEFYTGDTQTPEYRLDVLPEVPANPAATNDPTVALGWVDIALQGVQQQESVQNFQRMIGPIPAATIGGQTWQSGAAVFDVLQLHSRVQVYATLYQGRPYVITLLAPDQSFALGGRQSV